MISQLRCEDFFVNSFSTRSIIQERLHLNKNAENSLTYHMFASVMSERGLDFSSNYLQDFFAFNFMIKTLTHVSTSWESYVLIIRFGSCLELCTSAFA